MRWGQRRPGRCRGGEVTEVTCRMRCSSRRWCSASARSRACVKRSYSSAGTRHPSRNAASARFSRQNRAVSRRCSGLRDNVTPVSTARTRPNATRTRPTAATARPVPAHAPGQMLHQPGLQQHQLAAPPVPQHAALAARAPHATIVFRWVVAPHGRSPIVHRCPRRHCRLLQLGYRLPQPPAMPRAVQMPAAREGGAAAQPAVVHSHGGRVAERMRARGPGPSERSLPPVSARPPSAGTPRKAASSP